MKNGEGLDPHVDWRIMAESMKHLPPCVRCGAPYGNVSFGAEHWCGLKFPEGERYYKQDAQS